MKIYNFQTQLERSRKYSNFLSNMYSLYFPAVSGIIEETSVSKQTHGIDKVIVCYSGKQIYIEEKIRFKKYPDILIEWVSNTKTGAPGWAEKDNAWTDYLVYAMIEEEGPYIRPEVVLLPWAQFYTTWQRNKGLWINIHGQKVARNPGYDTISTPVPWHEFMNALQIVMTIE